MHVLNATELIPALQKQWRTVSFADIAADAGRIVGISKEGLKILYWDLTSEHGSGASWSEYIMPALGPAEDLNSIDKRSVEVFSADLEKLRARGVTQVGLWKRSR
ncbi:hypothetical protein GGR53DRAFT_192931 [Hypoxylon sp. FL1150]|nr:hypothetical protein GGR53DRAFT_192931 [Hypoxylon sp. FL1150]